MKIKKIGIITFHRAINYGAVLQTVGLYKAVSKLSNMYEVNILDYHNESTEKAYSPLKLDEGFKLKSIIRMIFYWNLKRKKRKKFFSFLKNNTILSDKYDCSTIGFSENEYDCFITGSDQVWNDTCVQFDGAYFLNFLSDSTKKNSYAASLGMKSIPEEKVKDYYQRLIDFNHISVREESANGILSELTHRNDIETVLDPTLLCDAEEWGNLAASRVNKEKYILMYIVNTPRNIIEFAKELSKKTGYPIYYISDTLLNRDKELQYMINVSPEEFLGLIKEAAYVVTNSFHGTAFSIIFERNFYVEIENIVGTNNRAKELIEKLGLESRSVEENSKNFQIDSIINWKRVNELLEKYRSDSIMYLKTVLL